MMQMIDDQKGAFSAGKAFSAGLTRIGKTVFDRVNKHTEDSKGIAKEKREVARVAQREKSGCRRYFKIPKYYQRQANNQPD